MFEALVITLREGVEAALVLAIAASLLRRRGLERLSGALFAGATLALAASVATAAALTRIAWNEELAEGIAMLAGAGLVLTLVWWMWKSGPHMKREIESGLERAAGGGSSGNAGGRLAVFLFAFGMVYREGVETAVFLSATSFNSQGVGRWIGSLAGLSLAALFGWQVARGTLRIALAPFFSLTSAVLLLVAFQLLAGGLHELSEAGVLPSSRAEMALIGPLVRSELLILTLTVALAAMWLLLGAQGSTGAAAPARGPAAPTASGPEARLARARLDRERSRRRWTGVVALAVVGFLATAFVQRSRLPERTPAQPLAIEGGAAAFDSGVLADGRLHFYQVSVAGPGSISGGAAAGAPASAVARPVRFFAVRLPGPAGSPGEIRTCLDACEICGDKGYYQEGSAVVCRNCTSPIVLSSLGRSGGCNPIPIPHALESGRCVVRAADLEAALPLLKGR